MPKSDKRLGIWFVLVGSASLGNVGSSLIQSRAFVGGDWTLPMVPGAFFEVTPSFSWGFWGSDLVDVGFVSKKHCAVVFLFSWFVVFPVWVRSSNSWENQGQGLWLYTKPAAIFSSNPSTASEIIKTKLQNQSKSNKAKTYFPIFSLYLYSFPLHKS